MNDNIFENNRASFGDDYSGYPITMHLRSSEFTFSQTNNLIHISEDQVSGHEIPLM